MRFIKAFWNGFVETAKYCAVCYTVLGVVFSVLYGVINSIVECTTWFDNLI